MGRSLTRVHIYTSPKDILDIARFFASSLLVSHGLRADVLAAVRFDGKRWLIARGRSVRHLRPDEDSLEGWIRAVLKGKPLGVQISESTPETLGPVVCLSKSEGAPLTTLIELGEPITVVYGEQLYFCDEKLKVELDLPVPLSVVIVNVLLDNWRIIKRDKLKPRLLPSLP